FAAVGLSAHALDELHGRPLRTHIPDAALVAVTVGGLVIAVVMGLLGLSRVGGALVPFIVGGPGLGGGYHAELVGGGVPTVPGLAAAWGTFPLVTAYVAQAGGVGLAAVLGGVAAFALSYAQRSLSTPARLLRRNVERVEGTMLLADGSTRPID